MPTEKLLTVEDVAAELQVHVVTVRRWLRAKKLRAAAYVSRQLGYRIRRQDLETFKRSGLS